MVSHPSPQLLQPHPSTPRAPGAQFCCAGTRETWAAVVPADDAGFRRCLEWVSDAHSTDEEQTEYVFKIIQQIHISKDGNTRVYKWLTEGE